MKTVFIIIKQSSEDYHGTYETVVGVYENGQRAKEVKDYLNDKINHSYDVQYIIDVQKLRK